MAGHARAITRSSTKLGLLAVGSFAAVAAAIGFGSGTANADVDEVGPSPNITASQTQNAVIRINDFGVARGISETRLADAGVAKLHPHSLLTHNVVVGQFHSHCLLFQVQTLLD